MIDISLLSKSIPLTLSELNDLVKKGCAMSKEVLCENWVFECVKIVNLRKDLLEQIMPTIEVSLVLFSLAISHNHNQYSNDDYD